MDGNCPEFADTERLDRLEGADKVRQRPILKPAVAVGYIRPGESVDARTSSQVTGSDFGQPTVISAREVVAKLPQLLVDDVEVVEESLLSGGNFPPGRDRRGCELVGGAERPAIVVEPWQQIVAVVRIIRDLNCCRKTCGVLLQSFGAKHLGADWLGRIE